MEDKVSKKAPDFGKAGDYLPQAIKHFSSKFGLPKSGYKVKHNFARRDIKISKILSNVYEKIEIVIYAGHRLCRKAQTGRVEFSCSIRLHVSKKHWQYLPQPQDARNIGHAEYNCRTKKWKK